METANYQRMVLAVPDFSSGGFKQFPDRLGPAKITKVGVVADSGGADQGGFATSGILAFPSFRELKFRGLAASVVPEYQVVYTTPAEGANNGVGPTPPPGGSVDLYLAGELIAGEGFTINLVAGGISSGWLFAEFELEPLIPGASKDPSIVVTHSPKP